MRNLASKSFCVPGAAILMSALLLSPGSPAAAPREPSAPADLARGRALAEIYCGACHLVPSPSLLTKSNWVHGALWQMAPLLGVARLNLDRRPDGQLLKEAKVFPDAPLLPRADWEAIVRYYSNAAPASLPKPKKITAQTQIFKPRPLLHSTDAPCTSLVQFDPGTRTIYVGDAQTRTLKKVDPQGRVLQMWELDSAPIALAQRGSKYWVTLVGRILPSDELTGQLWRLTAIPDAHAASPGQTITPSAASKSDEIPERILRGLRRPVHASLLDLDQDNREDVVISSFGNRLGRLSWFKQEPSGAFTENLLAETSGHVRCLPYDWNGDGLIDLTALRAQGREGCDLYLNQGGGNFQLHPLWNDPPSYGNAFFDLVDFDGDNRPELLVANGDNGDYPCAPKPYHGIRVFSINRDLQPELRFQFPLPGAYAARATDFDLDGDVDIAAISYFPDYENAAEQSFIYLRNEGNWRFTAQVLPGMNLGRWIVMDAGDLDGDGDIDLLLGSFIRGPLTIPIPESLTRDWESERLSILMLENMTRNSDSK